MQNEALELPQGAILPVFPGRLTLTGLNISAALDFEQWEEIVQRLAVMNESSGWWLGDALLYGERSYGERYTQAIEVTGLRYQTLANYVHTCRAIPQEERRDDLSFSHHAELSGVKNPSERAEWLEKAAQEEWSVSALRRARQEVRDTIEPEVPIHPADVEAQNAATEEERETTDEDVNAAIDADRNPYPAEEPDLQPVADCFQWQVGEWGLETFPAATLDTICEHVRREVKELAGSKAAEEAADILLLLFSFAHRKGFSLMEEARRKFEVVKCRQWGDPDEFGVVEHVKEAEACQL